MSIPVIRKLLEQRLASWAQPLALQVAYQNAPFDPPDSVYLTAFLLPGRTSGIDLAGAARSEVGIFHVNIVCPIKTGPGQGEALAVQLDRLFPNNLRLSYNDFTVQVVSPLSISSAVQDESSFTVPCSIQYRADSI